MNQPQAPQDPVADQQPTTHEPETKDDTSSSQTDHVETLTPAETNTNLIQDISNLNQQGAEVGTPSEQEQVFPTAQTKMVLPTLSRDVELVEEQAQPMLVAMDKQPAAVTPGTMQQNMLNLSNKTAQIKQEDYLGQQRENKQLNNIDLHAVNQGIDLLNKYHPGLGQATFQPVLQLLPTNPLMARQWVVDPQDLEQSQIDAVKQPDQAASKHGMNNVNTQESKLSANQNLDNSKDNNKKNDKQSQISKLNIHQQDIGSEVDWMARLSETKAAPGCGGIIGNISNDPGGFTVGCQQLACSGRLPEWVTYSSKTDGLAKDLAGVSCSRNRKKFSEVYMQTYHNHPKEVEDSQRHFMNQVTVQKVREIASKHGIDYDKLPLGTRQVLYSRVVQQQNGSNTVLSRACGTHCGELDGDTLINKIYEEIERGKYVYFKKTYTQYRKAFTNLFKKTGRMETERKLGIANNHKLFK